MKTSKIYIAFTEMAMASDGQLLPWAATLASQYERLAVMSSSVSITMSPNEADYILFVDCHIMGSKGYAERIRRSNLYRAFPDKVFVYDQSDNPRRGLPGLYVSMPRQLFEASYMRSVPYLHYEIDNVSYRDHISSTKSRFATFIGDSSTSRVRRCLFNMQTDCVEKVDTSSIRFHDYTSTRPTRSELQTAVQNYCNVLGASAFSLCPRGFGASSFRLYESMLLDSVPVIVADDFVPPFTLDSLHKKVNLRERDIMQICKHVYDLDKQSNELKAICNEFVQESLQIDKRLDFIVGELNQLSNHKCKFNESTVDKIIHKLYWVVHRYRESRPVR